MATGTFSYSTDVYKFKITYSNTNTEFKITGITVTGTDQAPYWANWELTPTIYVYAVKGNTALPKSYQSITLDAPEAKEWITDKGGKYQKVYEGNSPTTYLPTTDGGTKTWSSDNFDNIKLSLSGSSVNITVGLYIANTSGTLNDLVYGSDSKTLSLYTAPSDYSLECHKVDDVGTNSFKITHKWTKGTDSITTNKIVVKDGNTAVNTYEGLGNGKSITLSSNIVSNTYYTIVGTISDGTTTRTYTINRWTKPKITSNGLTLSLKSNKEHSVIIAKAEAATASAYDQFNFKINDGEWSGWTNRASSATRTYSNLDGNTKYTISFKMRNPHKENGDYDMTYYAGGIDDPTIISKTITTWHNPITDLSVVLLDRWFWALKIKAGCNYTGTITSYNFRIYNDNYDKSSGGLPLNNFLVGTSHEGVSGNLDPHTKYNCSVEVEDNHGRTYTAKAVYETLDDRPLYINGKLAEVKLIRPNSTVKTITPNLLTVVQSNGDTVNMNKIINNDDRTEFV